MTHSAQSPQEPSESVGTTSGSSEQITNVNLVTSTDDQIENELPKKRSSELAAEEDKVSVKRQELDTTDKEEPSASSPEPENATKNASSSSSSGSSGNIKKKESSSRDVNVPDAQAFGGRILTDESSVFDQNAW